MPELEMTNAMPDLEPVEGLITLETLRTSLLDAMDRKGPAERVFLASRRDGVVTGALTGVEIDGDDDVVLLFDDRRPRPLSRIWHSIERICDARRRDDPVFLKHARLGLVVGALVGAGPDRDGDMTLEYDFHEDVLAQHADGLADGASA